MAVMLKKGGKDPHAALSRCRTGAATHGRASRHCCSAPASGDPPRAPRTRERDGSSPRPAARNHPGGKPNRQDDRRSWPQLAQFCKGGQGTLSQGRGRARARSCQ
uniref:Uncharacterized protein n=1 Tax=Anguilla anguilla TaxID=7936 RepID=A0A0E9PCB7_ANGAN